jgi:pimeloyl-ACP methyl ester carboxylesterase/GNAT superfamily N-acetyltransferase
MSAYTAGDGRRAIERAHGISETPVGAERIELALHRDRPVSPAALRALYDHVGWDRPATEADLDAVLAAGPAVAAWDGEELVGFVRALSDEHLAAYVEDVMVHERCRSSGVGSALLGRLLAELEAVAVVTLFCAPGTAPFYVEQGFQPTNSVLLRRTREVPTGRAHDEEKERRLDKEGPDMKRRTFVASAVTAGTSLALTTSTSVLAQMDAGTATPASAGEDMVGTPPQTGYAPVNGLQMYYEIHGRGEPVVLIHGAFGTIDLWGPILETLAATYQVIAVELQGHGHTADIDRPFGYEQLADDIAALMAYLGIAQADIVGYSMGGNTGLQLAIRQPELVRKLVAISANYRSDGYYPEVLASIQEMTPEGFAGSPFEAAYFRNAPNPDDWPTLIEKVQALDAVAFAWPEEDIQAITAPVLLIIGDADVVRPEHAVALFRLLGGGVPGDLTGLPKSQLAILPGITHITMVFERTEVLLSLIEAFLEAPMPEGQ